MEESSVKSLVGESGISLIIPWQIVVRFTGIISKAILGKISDIWTLNIHEELLEQLLLFIDSAYCSSRDMIWELFDNGILLYDHEFYHKTTLINSQRMLQDIL